MSMTLPPIFEYDTPVSNFLCELMEAVSVRCEEWFNRKDDIKEACIAQGEKLKFEL